MRFSPPVGRLYARALLGRQSLFSPIPASKADMPLGGFTDGLPAGGTSRGEGAAARSRTGMMTGVYGRAVHDRCTRVCNPPLCPRGAFGGTVPGQLWRICGGFVMWVTAQSWVQCREAQSRVRRRAENVQRRAENLERKAKVLRRRTAILLRYVPKLAGKEYSTGLSSPCCSTSGSWLRRERFKRCRLRA